MKEPDPKTDVIAKAVVDAAFEVYKSLGPGFLECVYEEALCHELVLRKIPFKRQFVVYVNFKGHRCGESRIDILVDQRLIVELKTVMLWPRSIQHRRFHI